MKWKRIYERAGGAKMTAAADMQTGGWIRAIEARVKQRLWARLARDTQMHLIEYQLAHQFNLGIDVGRWLNLGIAIP